MVFPVLVILIFGIIDFGMGLRSYIALTNATREGARYGVVGNDAGAFPGDCDGSSNTTIVGRVCTSANGLNLDNLVDISVSFPDGVGPGNSLIVTADYTYTYFTPLGNMIDFVSGGAFPETLTLSSSTDMRQE